jgi:hypothetical protein
VRYKIYLTHCILGKMGKGNLGLDKLNSEISNIFYSLYSLKKWEKEILDNWFWIDRSEISYSLYCWGIGKKWILDNLSWIVRYQIYLTHYIPRELGKRNPGFI